MGKRAEAINILPPFNGEGDHLIFEVSPKTYFTRFSMPYYNLLSNTDYSLIEEFVHQYKILCAGFAWFHLNAMRSRCRNKVKNAKSMSEESFVLIRDFLSMRYKDILSRTDSEMCSLRQKALFSFVYKNDYKSVKANLGVLDSLDL